MEFKRELLIKAIGRVDTVISKRVVIPILENILIEVKNNECIITGTDLQTTMRSSFPVPGTKDTSFCINPKDVKQFLAELAVETIFAEVITNTTKSKETDENGNKAPDIMQTSLRIEYGLGSEISFPVYNSKEFPTVPDTGKTESSFEVDFKEFKDLIYKIKDFPGHDELRPVMAGALIEITKGETRATATDANKLASFRIENKSDIETSFVIPKESFLPIAKMPPKNAVIIVYEKNVKIKVDTVELIFRIVEGNYPKWRAVIPTDSEYEMIVEKAFLEKGLKIVSLSSQSQVVFKMDGENLSITGENIDFNKKGNFNMPTIERKDNRNVEGKPFMAGYNPRLLKTVLDAVPEGVDNLKVHMSATRALKIGDVTKDVLILMPIMI